MSNIENNPNEADKLWGGRFTESTDAFVEAFTASINFDKRLYKHDIAGSKAHAKMLQKVGILNQQEVDDIHKGLDEIITDIESGNFEWSIKLEDIHMNIEARLTDKIGITGKKLHTGRSRNDQVATDIRLWLREQIDLVSSELKRLQVGLLDLAEREAETILPGFTHLQVAQPITFGHHMMAWYEMLVRDVERLQDCRTRVNILPLGAAALAGTTYPIDRAYTAELLGFDRASNNSLDSVSDRDFAIEFVSAAALIMMHLSRFSE
ncbi:MAG: argininosuccinate lyase, partial [Cocleimonas sp.]